MGFRQGLVILIPQTITTFYMLQNRQQSAGGVGPDVFLLMRTMISFRLKISFWPGKNF